MSPAGRLEGLGAALRVQVRLVWDRVAVALAMPFFAVIALFNVFQWEAYDWNERVMRAFLLGGLAFGAVLLRGRSAGPATGALFRSALPALPVSRRARAMALVLVAEGILLMMHALLAVLAPLLAPAVPALAAQAIPLPELPPALLTLALCWAPILAASTAEGLGLLSSNRRVAAGYVGLVVLVLLDVDRDLGRAALWCVVALPVALGRSEPADEPPGTSMHVVWGKGLSGLLLGQSAGAGALLLRVSLVLSGGVFLVDRFFLHSGKVVALMGLVVLAVSSASVALPVLPEMTSGGHVQLAGTPVLAFLPVRRGPVVLGVIAVGVGRTVACYLLARELWAVAGGSWPPIPLVDPGLGLAGSAVLVTTIHLYPLVGFRVLPVGLVLGGATLVAANMQASGVPAWILGVSSILFTTAVVGRILGRGGAWWALSPPI